MGSDPEDLRLNAGGRLAIVAVIGQGLVSVVSRPENTLAPEATAVVFASAAAYLVFALWHAPVRWLGAVRYLVVENLFAAAVVVLGHGHMGLAPLAAISKCSLALPRRWAVLAAASHAVNGTFLVAHWFGWERVPAAVSPFVAAEVFVIAFTEIARGERQAKTDLAVAHRKLGEYATQAEELATVRERNRLARELHDSLGHYLTVIHVHLEAALSHVDRDVERTRSALRTAARLTHEGLDDVRRSVAALRASTSERSPLPDAVAALVAELTASGVKVHLEVAGVPRPLSPAVELTVYRAAQEALTNVRKHSGASRADVALAYDEGRVKLSVRDDGCGAGPEPGLGFGLLGVRERANLVGGALVLSSSGGFQLVLTIPTLSAGGPTADPHVARE